MGKIKITLPGNEIPVNGKSVSFVAPCDCISTSCLVIDGEDYAVTNALNENISGEGGYWEAGALITVILDVTNKKAYLQSSTAGSEIKVSTAELYGLDATATVDEIFSYLGGHWWQATGEKYNINVSGSADRKICYGQTSSSRIEIRYSDTYNIKRVSVSNNSYAYFFSLSHTTVIQDYCTADASILEPLRGKYFMVAYYNDGDGTFRYSSMYYAKPDAAYHKGTTNSHEFWIECEQHTISDKAFTEYAFSIDENTYPHNGIAFGDDRYAHYLYLGTPFKNARDTVLLINSASASNASYDELAAAYTEGVNEA